MFTEIYTFSFAISFVLLILLITFFKDRISIYYVMLFSSILITNFGYMQMADANTIEMAVYANQVSYLGACFLPFFLIMCLADLCKFPLKRIYQSLFILFGCLVFFMISSIGTFSWYYKSVDIASYKGITYLAKEYGPLHLIYPIYLFVLFAISVYIITFSIVKKKDVSHVISVWMLTVMVLTMLVYFVEKGFHLKLAILPFAYIIAETVMMFLLRRISLYDIKAISASSISENKTVGFVLFDKNGRYLGCDDAAKVWFDELNELHVDKVLNNESTKFLKQMGVWIRGEDKHDKVVFEKNKRMIEATHRIIEDRKRELHFVYLRDDTQNQKHTGLMQKYNMALERSVNTKAERIQKIQNDIILGMASIVENRDNSTGGHIARTSDIVSIFIKHLQKKQVIKGLTPDVAECIIKAAPLHDFGKIGISDAILNKPGKFTDEEYEIMKEHAEKGAVIVAKILKNVDDDAFKKIAINVAHYHHERWDGSGYPEGIAGQDIPFEARVMALADVYDALVSKRVYKEAFSYEKAISIIEESCGTHFDPVLCKAFVEIKDELANLYSEYED